MVTGVETAGLVLAALPLLISALGEYMASVRKIRRSVKYESELKKLIRSVKEQKIFFTDNLQKLLNAAAPESSEVRNLSDDYSLELWSGATGKRVQEYLGKEKYDLFQESVGEFESCLRNLAAELDHVRGSSKKTLGKDPLTLQNLRNLVNAPSEPANFFTKRIKYLIREDDVIRLTKQLDGLNLNMDRLLNNSSTLRQHLIKSAVIKDGNASKLAASLQLVREHADRLYQAFCEMWTLDCHPSHEAMLFLDTPVFSRNGSYSLNSKRSIFRLVLRWKPTAMSIGPSWHETTVTVSDVEDIGGVGLICSQVSQMQVSGPSISISPPPTALQEPIQTRVLDLCEGIARAREAKRTFDLHLLQGKHFACRDLNLWPSCTTTSEWNTITLEQLVCEKRRIFPGQKVSMALKLAASLLQLKTSQWLRAAWTDRAIHFPRSSPQNIDVGQPLIPQKFPSNNPVDCIGLGLEERPKPMFLELGILLLEIWNQETFIGWAKAYHKVDQITDVMRLGLADRWYEDTVYTMSVRYGKVVRTCLAFAFEYDQGLPSWDDMDLRISVCAKIIEPLLEECDSFPSPR